MGRPARLGLVSVLLVSSGCAQIAGIDNTTGAVPPELASLTLDRISVGATLVSHPLDLTGLTATYLLANPDAPDGFDRIPATVDETTPNMWTAKVGEGTPPVMFTVPDYPEATSRIIALPNRNVTFPFVVYEHPDPTPAIDPAMISVQAPLPTPYATTESFSFLVVGTWNSRGFSGAEVPVAADTVFGPVSFAYTTTTRLTGRPFEAITTADSTLLLRYLGARLTGVTEGTPFDQTGADMVNGTMSAVAATETMTAMLDNTTVAARFTPLRPAMTAVSMSWNLTAAPGSAFAANRGPTLNSDPVLAADPSTISVPYGNPFASKGWKSTVEWSASSTRSYAPSTQPAAPATLGAGLTQVVEPSPDMVLEHPAGLPELITLDEQPLSTDGIAIEKPIKALPASFIVPPMPENTLYHLQVVELVPNGAGTASDRKVLLTITSNEPDFLVPPEFFESGKAYTLRAITHAGGYPNLVDGDLATRSLPFAQGFMDSGVITVN